MKKSIYAFLLLVASTFTVVAMAQLQEPENDIRQSPEYIALHETEKRLAFSEDSVRLVATDIRNQFKSYTDSLRNEGLEPTEEELSRYTDRILELEQEAFDLLTERGDIIARINAMDQEWVMSQMNSSQPIVDETLAQTDTLFQDSDLESVVPASRNLVENICIKDALSGEDYAELLAAHTEDAEMDALIAEYTNIYNRMADTAEQYLATDSEAEAEELFKQYHTLVDLAESVANKIDSRWNHILDTKYFAYGYILERDHHYELLDSSSMEFTTMRRECAREAGYYASDAVMHYAMGRPTLRKFEYDFAKTMGLEMAADSIATVSREAQEVEYRFDPITLERRLFIDYQPITIGRTNFYRESNPIPELKVYERGVIYRILLGEFRNKQPMTLFKGVQPLYITRNDEGHYLYYAGGFATRLEADEAQLFLKEKGFKSPEICRWQDGTMTNLSATATDSDGDAEIPMVGKRYMVKIGVESIDDRLNTVLTTEAPGKRISKTSSGFTVGTFDSRDEAEMLKTTLTEGGETSVEVIEIELN